MKKYIVHFFCLMTLSSMTFITQSKPRSNNSQEQSSAQRKPATPPKPPTQRKSFAKFMFTPGAKVKQKAVDNALIYQRQKIAKQPIAFGEIVIVTPEVFKRDKNKYHTYGLIVSNGMELEKGHLIYFGNKREKAYRFKYVTSDMILRIKEQAHLQDRPVPQNILAQRDNWLKKGSENKRKKKSKKQKTSKKSATATAVDLPEDADIDYSDYDSDDSEDDTDDSDYDFEEDDYSDEDMNDSDEE